jgi:hypothetical protein
MYASEPGEVTPEKRLPDTRGAVHGLFTYTLASVLLQSRAPLTYRELADRIGASYRASGRWSPSPALEGGGVDREVLGQRTWPDRPRFLVERGATANTRMLRAGLLHGVRPGTILALYPPAGSARDEVIGHVTVVDARGTTATLEPVAYDGRAAPLVETIPLASRARVVWVDHGERQLRVAAQIGSPGAGQEDVVIRSARPADLPDALRTAFLDMATATRGLAGPADTPEDATWFVRLTGTRVELLPASGWMRSQALEQTRRSAVFIGDVGEPSIGTTLHERLRRIAAATQLMAIASAAPPVDDNGSPRVQISATRSAAGKAAGERLATGATAPVLHVGDRVTFEVRNPGRTPVDVTLLYIDSGYGIQALFPSKDQGLDNRLAPGEIRSLQPYTVDDSTLGQEHIIAIAVRSGPVRVDFTGLEQPTLEMTRGATALQATPLGRLLAAARYGGEGTTRGLAAAEVSDYAMALVTWRSEFAAADEKKNLP